MSTASHLKSKVRRLVAEERGTLAKEAPERVALVYPSPYRAGMSSLGYQTIYREINSSPGRSAERAFLPDDVPAYARSRTPLFTYESERPVGDLPIIAFSVAYEMEIAGVIQCLELAGLPALAADRDDRHPLVLAGGPLTFSNPVPLAPYVDAVLMGEAEDSVHRALDIVFESATAQEAREALARDLAECWVPSLSNDELPSMGRSERLPAYGQITTPHTELRNMFLIEGERGCSRGCAYCVMRRSTNGGMRIVPMERIIERVPQTARRVGLVGAAISDHPKIADLVETLANDGREVGLSSLRPDRLNDRLAAALRAAGHRTLTTASDGASQRLRDLVNRRARERHLDNAIRLVREHGFDRLKLYMILGLPEETEEDIDELVRFATGLSRVAPLSLGVAPFVSKRNTPLDQLPFMGIAQVDRHIERLRRGLKGRVELRSTSARWAWVEWVLAQGGRAEGRAVLDAVHAGGRFRDYQRAFARVSTASPRATRQLPLVAS